MAAITREEEDRLAFEDAIQSLEAQIANLGVHLTIDSHARVIYAREIKKMSDELRNNASTGKITWAQAAQEAQETRNLIMDIVRRRSTSVGRSMAQRLKAQGYSLNELIGTQTTRKYGESAVFSKLTTAQQNKVYADIVMSAGKSNPGVTRAMSRFAYAGRGLILFSIGLSAYTIATSTNKTETAMREAALTGAGIGGGIAGGALAGLACGPGAPVCVTVGAFVGGALSALGVSRF